MRIGITSVLGDKAVEVSIGSPDQPALPDGAELQTGTSGDISSILKATGEIIGERLHFQSERLRGWAMDVPDAPGTTVLLFESLDGSGLQVQEVSQLVDGGRRRLRTTQILREGRLVGRSHIDERKTSHDPFTWTAPP